MASGGAHVWMDQGGTFTDVVRVGTDGSLVLEKVPSDRADLSALGVGFAGVRRGTTVATNALLERRGVPVLLVTTRGMRDLPWIGDQTRPDLFSLEIRRPEPLCAAVVEARGRIAADGSILEPASVDEEGLARARAAGIETAAVVLVHGPLRPEEETRLGDACLRAGFRCVTLGHEVVPSRGFLARLHTALADAALTPLLPDAAGLWMCSDGGLARHPVPGPREWRGCHAVLSGPAGGVVATAALAARAGVRRAFGLDVGGTSTDVCRVEGAAVERTDHQDVAGVHLRIPAVRLVTVAAGGGSRLSVQGGVFRVGPKSAGADPGPAAYGRGGPAALTDAEAVLGRLPAFPRVCGPGCDGPLDVEAATRAIAGLDPTRPVEDVAAGFRRVAAAEVARAVRRLAASDGVDPADHALVAFGGAGPGHACAVARELGVREVLVPFLAGAFSAVGIGMARRRAERVVPVVGGTLALPALGRAREEAIAGLPFPGRLEARVALRHAGTSEVIEVPWEEDAGTLLASFHAAHRTRFGFDRLGQAVEAVEVRVAVEEDEHGAVLPEIAPPCGPGTETRAWFDGWASVPVVPIHESGGVVGPAILAGAGTTAVVEPGWHVETGPGFARLRDRGARATPVGTAFHPVRTAVLSARVMAVAEQMGERLCRLARSVSIRERRDFSCAVFDAGGRLVANAPHVPVHLGAMGETVRGLLGDEAVRPRLAPGQCWASNDPYCGGSHLPDITVMAPVFSGAERIAWVACRGHHVDVGGSRPGSMPPRATRIEEEGFVLRNHLLVHGGALSLPDLAGSRQPGDVQADLEAQAAACAFGAGAIAALAGEIGPDALAAQFGHLLEQAARAVEDVLGRLGGVHAAEELLDDGTPIRVRLEVVDRRARLVVRAPRHPGNLNAPRAVARAALLYVFRCLVHDDVPLNEGALDPFDVDLEAGGLFDPSFPVAVAGGNVETSQRLVDALLRAVGAQAASQGTMNNLTVGTARGAWYETIGGGSGAGPSHAGAHAVQVHMTNTRATDVEELETRFPVRLERWERRTGSGGAGVHAGGDGVVKEWTFLDQAEVALLAGRRDRGAPGIEGGGEGATGRDERNLGHGWEPSPVEWVASAGDRLRIATPGGGGWGR